MPPQIDTYSEFGQQIHRDRPLWTRDVTSRRPSFHFIRIQQLIAVVTLSFLVWLWFGVSRHGAPRPSYPYYDTQKPVPPWSEPASLEGNYNRKGDYNEHSR